MCATWSSFVLNETTGTYFDACMSALKHKIECHKKATLNYKFNKLSSIYATHPKV